MVGGLVMDGPILLEVPTSIGVSTISGGGFLIVGCLGGGGSLIGGSFLGGSNPGGGLGVNVGTGVAGGGVGYGLTGGDPFGGSITKIPVVDGGASLPASVEGCFGGGPAGRPPCIDGDASDVTAPMLVLCSPDEAEPVPRLPVAFPAVPTWTGAV